MSCAGTFGGLCGNCLSVGCSFYTKIQRETNLLIGKFLFGEQGNVFYRITRQTCLLSELSVSGILFTNCFSSRKEC